MTDREARKYLRILKREYYIYKALLYTPFLTYDSLVEKAWFGRIPAQRLPVIQNSVYVLRTKLNVPIENRYSIGYTIPEPARTQHRLRLEALLATEVNE